VAVWTSLVGENGLDGNGSSAKTVVFSSHAMILASVWKTVLFGSGNGYWNDRHLRHWAATAGYP
jgi:hypothetical protein